MNNLIGKRFGKLVVMSSTTENGRKYWYCQCDCGNQKKARTDYLKNGKTTSCGCSKKSLINDLTGQKFGRLTAISSSWKDNKTFWKCVCDCGENTEVRSDHLLNGSIKSCGCLHRENAIKHLVEGRIKRRVFGVDAQQLKQKLSSRNKSGYTGVFYNRYKNSWYATLGIRNKHIAVKCENKDDAIRVRKELVEKYHKPYLKDESTRR